ncbi:CAP domain-containing protein [Gracilibacillus sp. YIM 98692]|uniref:CAP domain-containing protein n=1 Tax=Gracilibacillus sp. YIM 98692 TaxID=2663532 RepID=UPI0013D54DE2|nr:CAP domain-containing protein [Gracilibacillus sp. YIM 98692]
MNKRVFLLFSILCLFLIVACNQQSLEPENEEGTNPEYVGFGGDQGGGDNPQITERRFRVPITPGKEQNIFGDEDRYTQRYQDGERNDENNQQQQQNLQQNQQQNQQQEQADQGNEPQGNTNQGKLGDFRQKVIDLTNQRRSENGAGNVSLDQELAEVAQKKSQDMAENNYFSHTSPTYGSPFNMLDQFGVDYTKASENIAAGQTSPEQVVESWMNSEGHRKNLLDPAVTHIGVGYASDGDYWTQLFIKK